MSSVVIFLENRIKRAFTLTLELFETLSDSELPFKISEKPSNSFKDQVWCIIGARESYHRAIIKDTWDGFQCSLKNSDGQSIIINLLKKTNDNLLETISNLEFSENQSNLLFDLLEHEIQHHGQLIRIVYANRLPFPKSWNSRYTV